MPTTDILLDDNNDLRIENGDFVVGDSTKQHQKLLLMLSKGDTRQFALDGVGVVDFIEDEGATDLMREIRKQYVRDGMTVKKLSVGSDGQINVNAPYE
jgi:hypothetical protein